MESRDVSFVVDYLDELVCDLIITEYEMSRCVRIDVEKLDTFCLWMVNFVSDKRLYGLSDKIKEIRFSIPTKGDDDNVIVTLVTSDKVRSFIIKRKEMKKAATRYLGARLSKYFGAL